MNAAPSPQMSQVPAKGATPDSAALYPAYVNTQAFLSVVAVERAKSGDLGLPMGPAAMACELWTQVLRRNLANPQWLDRDSSVLCSSH